MSAPRSTVYDPAYLTREARNLVKFWGACRATDCGARVKLTGWAIRVTLIDGGYESTNLIVNSVCANGHAQEADERL